MLPVFSLVLDEDVTSKISLKFPELYLELQKGRALSLRNFLVWVMISLYQGGAIMILSVMFFDSDLNHIVSITFTCLILTELMNIMFLIRKWNWMIIAAETSGVMMYFISMLLLPMYFETRFIASSFFWWRVFVVICIASLPVSLLRLILRRLHPPSYEKITKAERSEFEL